MAFPGTRHWTPIDAEAAAARGWDVVIAGSSFAAMFFLMGLPQGLSVLVIEKGPVQPHEDQLARGLGGAEDFAQDNRSGHRKDWIAHSLFGGNSHCWWACTPRFHPHDFRMGTLYGRGMDWPLGYEDLEPHYADVEDAMQIAGGGSDHILPRSRPFPFAPHAGSRTDAVLRAADDRWFAQPTARSNGGARAVCCTNGVCNLCPVDAKFTILNGLESFDRPGTHLLLGAEVRALDIGAGTARAVEVRLPDGSARSIRADLVALGTNAVFNAAILMRSGLTAPALGRYLHEQVSQMVTLDIDRPNYFGATSITGHGYGFYDGSHRRDHAAVLMENWNAPPAIRPVPGRWTERLLLKLIAEDLPQADNRVVLDGDSPRLIWQGHDPYAAAGLAAVRTALPDALPFRVEGMTASPLSATEAHIQGTTRMGRDVTEGVIDRDLRCFEARNVLALGAGAFPSCSPANPTLTLSALSLRAARVLA